MISQDSIDSEHFSTGKDGKQLQHSNVSSKMSSASSTSSSKNDSSLPIDSIYPYNILPSTISGVLHPNNLDALDWSNNGLIAYGSHNRVIVVDANTCMSYCQSLHRHKHSVCLVKWSPLINNLCLVSVDTSGVIIVWNVLDSSPLTVILPTSETKKVNFIHWIVLEEKNNDIQSISTQKLSSLSSSSNSFLLAFYQQNGCFILYDADLGDPVVKWQLEFAISNVSFNPFFQFNRSCDSSVNNIMMGFKSLLGDEKIYFGFARINESDFTNSSTSKELKTHVLSFNAYMFQNSFEDHGSTNKKNPLRFDHIAKLDKTKYSQHLQSIFDVAHQNPTSLSSASYSSVANSVQFEYHKAVRNQVFVVFARDIYLIDITTEIVISAISIERNCSKAVKIYPCSQRNAFFVFHESGNVSFRLFQKKIIRDRHNSETRNLSFVDKTNSFKNDLDNFPQNFLNIGYINMCQSEPIRLTKQNKIFGFAVMPFRETQVAFLLSSGRIIVKSLIFHKTDYANSISNIESIVDNKILFSSLHDIIKPQDYKLGSFLLSDQELNSIQYKIIVTQFLSGLNSNPTVVKMCPPLTLQNIQRHKPFLAIGDSLGIIQVWLLNNSAPYLHREFSAHSYPIVGIEWTGLNSLISFSYPAVNSPSHSSNTALSAFNIVTGSGGSNGRVTNELVHIDITTGKVTPFRTNHVNDISPIETIRVSHLKQYLIILFKRNDPFEIWNVNTLTILRVMPKSMVNISAVEWSPLYNRKQVAKNNETNNPDTNHKLSIHVPIKENFIVTNRDLYHFSIEGNIVRELACIPPDSESGNINVTSIAWKSDQVLLGDASGTLNVWDLKRKISRTESTFRGYIRKIKFGPGRGNMKCLILYADFGVGIWDISEFRVCAQLKYPRDMNFKIIDIDWASCDLPILCTTEGCIFITDSKLKTYSSPIAITDKFGKQFEEIYNPKINRINGWCRAIDLPNINFISFGIKKKLLQDLMLNNINQTIDLENYIATQTSLAKMFVNIDDYDFWLILNSILHGEELDSRLDLFLDSNQFKLLQQEKLLLLETNRKTYSHARYAYELNLRLKNYHRAVQILLETESSSPNQQHETKSQLSDTSNLFYVDALKACLIASLQSGTTSKKAVSRNNTNCDSQHSSDGDCCEDSDQQSASEDEEHNSKFNSKQSQVAPVVKLVATSLIANGKILEGVELLNFISKTSDSCRYLQSSEKWLDSIWLAKTSLDTNECTEVMRRWCDYLISSKRNSDLQTSIKMYLSRRQFSRVLRTLNRFSDLKALPFAIVCIVAQLIDLESNRDIFEEIFDKFVRFFFEMDTETIEKVKKGRLESISANEGDMGQFCEYEQNMSDSKECHLENVKLLWRLLSISNHHDEKTC